MILLGTQSATVPVVGLHAQTGPPGSGSNSSSSTIPSSNNAAISGTPGNPNSVAAAAVAAASAPAAQAAAAAAALRALQHHVAAAPSVYEMAALTQDLDTQTITTKIKEALLANNIGQKVN